jgi:DNA (cytosine-5)-methyltransferase 1
MTGNTAIPVIDLFAGPGGLCEGFSSIVDESGARRFHVKVSIEKDQTAHKTLTTRAIFRQFPKGNVPTAYYDYVKGNLTRGQFLAHPDIKAAAELASTEARLAELGAIPPEEVDAWIEAALGGATDWVLIGGPPCQAYSLAGRSRMRQKDVKAFEDDKRHFLYQEYLRIIERFEPAVFVMENVKGMLNSQHGGSSIFQRILSDLQSPRPGLKYEIRSLVVAKEQLAPTDYVIEADDHGVPQSRHRVILCGIRSDVLEATPALRVAPHRFLLKKQVEKVSVETAFEGLPKLRSKLSREPDSLAEWRAAVAEAPGTLNGWDDDYRARILTAMDGAIDRSERRTTFGQPFLECHVELGPNMPAELRRWYQDPKLGGVLQHESRSHMRSDLHRYMFAACYAEAVNARPTLNHFPPNLMPAHGNVIDREKATPFLDRFRVQMRHLPCTTVVAHISKDGHYYIHYDASQCRSFTVREAARLQTFPDNYFFEGTRTQQYHQIGNAVPPLLARKIGEVVLAVMTSPRVAVAPTETDKAVELFA